MKLNKKFAVLALVGSLSALVLVTTFQNCSAVSFETADLTSKSSFSVSNELQSLRCSFNGSEVAEGAFVTAYLNSNSNCHLSESRVCQNGRLFGSYSYASCTNGSAAACVFDGKTILSGQSVPAYLVSSVPSGSSCVQEMRSCTNGILSGSYAYASCGVAQPVACTFNGQTIAHGGSVVAYTASSGTSCSPSTRVCNNGELSGSGSYANCTVNAPASCYFNGKTIAHGAGVNAYSTSSSSTGSCNEYRETRICNNGVLSGSYESPSCSYSYYNWSVAAPVFGPCGGPGGYPGTAAARNPALSCSQANEGQELYENLCGSGTQKPWICKRMTQVLN